MKSFLRVVIFSVFVLAPVAWADGPDDTYVTIYTLIQQGDALNEKVKGTAALAKYIEAQTALVRFQKANPGWNEKVVNYRLKYLAGKIDQIQSNTPPPVAPEKALAAIPASRFAPPVTNAAPVPTSPAAATVPLAQIQNLEEQIHQLESDKSLLEAKLKESFAAQPGPVNPQEFAKAQDQIKGLEKENALLKTTLTQLKGANGAVFPANPDALQQELSDTKRKVVQLTQDNAALTAEKTALQERIKTLGKPDEATVALREENALLKKQLADVNAKVAAATPEEEWNRRLKETQTQLAALQSDKELLQQEKLALEKRIELLAATPPPASPSVAGTIVPALAASAVPLNIPPAEAAAPVTNTVSVQAPVLETNPVPTQVAVPPTNAAPAETSAPTNNIIVSTTAPEKPTITLTNSGPAAAVVSVATNLPTIPTNSVADTNVESSAAERLAQLEAQRDELQKSIGAATRDIYGKKKGKEMSDRIQEMSRQLGMLRARIEVLEAHPIPYTPYELAVMGAPETTLAVAGPAGKKKAAPPAAGTQVLLSEARGFFVAHQLEQAEARYLEALKIDTKNPSLYADLANIQGDLGKTNEAATNIKMAVSLAPDDDYILYTMGKLKFQQKKYDEAFDALSRAGQINPQNATLQNLLGLTLSEKGLRGPAETAFRKAIQIDPGFTDAHINLAVVYITQQPPLSELARWHYQKAIAAGHKPNFRLEKMLEPGPVSATGNP